MILEDIADFLFFESLFRLIIYFASFEPGKVCKNIGMEIKVSGGVKKCLQNQK